MKRSATATALRAYELWHSRGCPHGSPEVDWYQAELDLVREREASTVGSAAGTGSRLSLSQEMRLRAFISAFDGRRPHRLRMCDLRYYVDVGYLGINGLLAQPTSKAREFCRSTPTLRLIGP